MNRSWWKILSVVILGYVLIAGMLVPLKPGIESAEPSRVDAGELLVLRVKGYNTDFTRVTDSMRAWLKLDDEYAILANQVLVRDERHLRASFSIPFEIPVKGGVHAASLVLDDPWHGAIVMPSAVFISGGTFEARSPEWTVNRIENITDRQAFEFPYRSILYETIRNTYYHVPMWFGMIILFFISAWHSIRYMRKGQMLDDLKATALLSTGTVFGMLGLITGMFWSTYTWGAPWSWDIKQNVSAITLLIYFAYFILRQSFEDPERRARIAGVYNVFACAMLIPLLFVIPRLTDSLHPGSGGNPAIGGEDLDNTMRAVFYPAVIGWTLLGLWISLVFYRLKKVKYRLSF